MAKRTPKKQETGVNEYLLDISKHFGLTWSNVPFYNEMIHIELGDIGPRQISYKRYHLILLVTMMEAFAFQLRQTLFSMHEKGVIRISKTDLVRLSRKKYDSYEMIKDTWKVHAKKFRRKAVLMPLFSGPEMQALKRTFEKRNAIIHPKTHKDLHVSDAQYAESIQARKLFHSLFKKLLAGNVVEVRNRDQ